MFYAHAMKYIFMFLDGESCFKYNIYLYALL